MPILPRPYMVAPANFPEPDYFVIEMHHPTIGKYISGFVGPSGRFLIANDHLTRAEFKALGSFFN